MATPPHFFAFQLFCNVLKALSVLMHFLLRRESTFKSRAMKRLPLILAFLICWTGILHSQERSTEFRIDFRVNCATIDTAYADNAEVIRKLSAFLSNSVPCSKSRITRIEYLGTASPEGSHAYNSWLASGRMEAIETLTGTAASVPDSVVFGNWLHFPYEHLAQLIEASAWEHKDTTLAILNGNDYINRLKKLDNGRVWKQINKLFLSDMRYGSVVITTYTPPLPAMTGTGMTDGIRYTGITSLQHAGPPMVMPQTKTEWTRRICLKTNAIGWGLGISNAAAEIDLIPHLSLNVPIYYSAVNYFVQTLKFRTFSIHPEVRWWPFSTTNSGLFAGVHAALTSYNFAFDGGYRYQDHGRKSPALGGGIGIGYSLPIRKIPHLKVEFTLGAGVYSIHYDKFYNTPNTADGLLVDSVKGVYWGLDQVAVSLSYSFDLKKKGGKR